MTEGSNEAPIPRSELRTNEEALDWGAVEPLQDYPIAEQHRANTARYLAYALVATLALSVVFQYVSTMILIYTGKTDAIPNLDKTFNILMPLLSGLVGGATTYHERKEMITTLRPQLSSLRPRENHGSGFPSVSRAIPGIRT